MKFKIPFLSLIITFPVLGRHMWQAEIASHSMYRISLYLQEVLLDNAISGGEATRCHITISLGPQARKEQGLSPTHSGHVA